MKKQAGFTLVELMFAVALVGLLAAIVLVALRPMFEHARYKEASRNVTSALREARSQAISRNLEHRIQFDLDTGEYWLERGNNSSASTLWPKVHDYVKFTNGVVMAAGDGDPSVAGDLTCDVTTGVVFFEFNPNGTAESDSIGSSAHICVLDTDNTKYFATGYRSVTTGRVKIWRGNGNLAWKD